MSSKIVIIFELFITLLTVDHQGDMMNTDSMSSEIAVRFHTFTTILTVDCHGTMLPANFLPKLQLYLNHLSHSSH